MRRKSTSTNPVYSHSFTSLDPRLELVISRRWKEVLPQALVLAKKRARDGIYGINEAGWVEIARLFHRQTILQLRKLSVEMRTIRSRGLDSPNLVGKERDLMFEPYMKGNRNAPAK